MSTASTIARPYAKAAFEYAREHHAEKAWAEALENLAGLFGSKELQSLLHHPKLSQKELAEAVLEKTGLEQPVQNFIRIMAEHSRLALLAKISEIYAQYLAESQTLIQARLISASKVDQSYIEQIKQALSKRLNQSVALEIELDESLIGGAVIKAGDLVIDGSVKGRLNRLAQELRK